VPDGPPVGGESASDVDLRRRGGMPSVSAAPSQTHMTRPGAIFLGFSGKKQNCANNAGQADPAERRRPRGASLRIIYDQRSHAALDLHGNDSILRRFLHPIDHEDLHRGSRPLQFQTKLVAQSQ
jgi:hypothetical protein